MCGIAGTIGIAAPSIIDVMTDTLSHRGPDDRGTALWPDLPVALGHRRLSIIDLSDAGHQPMLDGSGRYAIVFNGEIYNYRELRNELRDTGHPFHTDSDTEVLLAAYAEWGENCPEHLRGMFAFTIVDLVAKTAFLCRDRFGIKPLYIAPLPGKLFFASEIRSFLEAGIVPRKANRHAIWHYLSLGSIRPPDTIIEGVSAVPPGSTLLVGMDGTILKQKRYWDIAHGAAARAAEVSELSFQGAAAALREQLEEATRYHLVSDVPVGAFLSGGIDSAAMVAFMGRQVDQPIRTFTVGFDRQHSALSETAAARETAEHFGAIHSEIIVPDVKVAEQFGAVLDALDQPSMDGTNTFFVSQAASAEVKVVLSGLGGDELFAGYPHFKRHRLAASFSSGGGPLLLLQPLRLLPDRFRHNLVLPALSEVERLATLRCLAYDAEKRAILAQDFVAGLDPDDLLATVRPHIRPGLDPISQLSVYELEGYMSRTLLRDSDVMGMAHGLEIRPILLDHHFAEFAMAIPSRYKLVGGTGKAVFNAALAGLLPDFIRQRPKRGFELPLLGWLSGPLQSIATEAFSSSQARELFSETFLDDARSRLRAPVPRDFRLWPYFILLAWLEWMGVKF